MEPLHESLFKADIYNDIIFFKTFPFCNKLRVFIDYKTVTVENKLVLAANRIEISNDQTVVRGPGREHLKPRSGFSHMIRRCIDVNYELRAMRGLYRSGAVRIPDILAYIDSEFCCPHLVDGITFARLEVTKFVKHAVVGQMYLVIHVEQFPLMYYSGRIINVFAFVDEPHYRNKVAHTLLNFLKSFDIVIDKMRLQ